MHLSFNCVGQGKASQCGKTRAMQAEINLLLKQDFTKCLSLTGRKGPLAVWGEIGGSLVSAGDG